MRFSIVRFLARPMLAGLAFVGLAWGCKTAAPPLPAPPAQPVVLTLGPKDFTADDFFQSYTKNQAADSAQRTDIREYLGLYTNLKLKVLAAEQAGRDTTEGFREEIETYRKQLAQSYLTDKVLVEQLASEAYQRMQTDIRASHLLIAVSEDAAPADTLRAHQTALDLRDRLLKGAPFAELARQFSSDKSVAQNGGDLGYFSAFQTVYPFESAAYRTAKDGLTIPVRTRFGYHLITVTDRRPSRGKMRVAHILLRMSPSADDAGQQAVKTRIDEVYARLQRGEAFEPLAKQFSDDMQSKNTGGVLPMFGTGQNVPAFEDAAFSLNTPGSYTAPFRTNYGWHIVKLLDRRPLEPYTEMGASLRQRVVTDSRADELRQATLQRLRKEYVVQEDPATRQVALSRADSSLLRGTWKIPSPLPAELANRSLFTVSQKQATVAEFFEYVRRKQQPRAPGSDAATTMRHLYDRFLGDRLLATEEANLEKKYPEFRALLAEIRDGVLLSQEMEANVWERSMADSVGQQNWYAQNLARYRYPDRVQAIVLTAPDEARLKQAQAMLATKPYNLRRSSAPLAFAPNQTTLTPTLRETVAETMVTLLKNQEYVVEITGSHDDTERDSVSAGRIRAIVNYLTANGVSLSRIMEKDQQGFRAGVSGAAARQVTFQLFSNSKKDVERVLNTTGANQPAGVGVSITEGLFTKGQNAVVDAVTWQSGTTNTKTPDGNVATVTINRVEAARAKTFAEARGTVINEYQAFLEKQWLAGLKQKFPVRINEDEMRKLVK
jgi:peptidyl-prolyl cis-trans isomerase SurA